MRVLLVRGAGAGLALVLAVALFANGDAGVPTPPPWDKVAHFGYFGLFTAALWLGAGGRAPWAVLLAVSAALGVADEWRQLYLPHRQASLADWGMDLAGAGTALAVLGGWSARRLRAAGAAPRLSRAGADDGK